MGNSAVSSGFRIFRLVRQKDKFITVLESWIDRHCKYCGKFINRHNTAETCKKCELKGFKDWQKGYDFLKYHKLLKYYR